MNVYVLTIGQYETQLVGVFNSIENAQTAYTAASGNEYPVWIKTNRETRTSPAYGCDAGYITELTINEILPTS